MQSETARGATPTYQSDAERAWVERFLSHGGSATDAVDTYRRMSAAGTSKMAVATTPAAITPPAPPVPAPLPPAPTQLDPNPQAQLAFEEAALDELKEQALTAAPAPKEPGELGFVTSTFVFGALPHRAVKGGIYQRKTSDMTLTVMNDPDIGIPYGRYPRLLLAHICTLAKKTGESRLQLGDTQIDFLRRLGLASDSGGERAQMALVRQRTIQLLTSAIRLQKKGQDSFSFINVQVADQGSLIWTPHTNLGGINQYKWQGFIDLSNQFFEQCVNHSLPIDLQVIKKYRSSLAIDIYIWLTFRMNAIKTPLRLTWDNLKFQFGNEYADDYRARLNFKAKFLAQLRIVREDYPYANITEEDDHILIKPSRTHIGPR